MAERPGSLSDRPNDTSSEPRAEAGPGVDPLSDVLQTVRLTGAVFFMLDLAPPWTTEVPDGSTLASILAARAQTIVSYHVVTRGTLWCGLPGGAPVALAEGDVLVFPRGDAYFLSMTGGPLPASDPDATLAFFHACAAGQVPFAVNAGGEGARAATLLCGFLACDLVPYNPILGAMPRLLVLRRSAVAAGDGLDQLIGLTVAESREQRAGKESIRLRLSELMFVEVLRRYVATLSADENGWLAGMRDPVVGRALAQLHEQPARAWTLQQLARDVGTSRSALADRFARLVGEPPMQYLMRWRMQVAARRLSEGVDKVSAIALDVGYDSEASFSRAFKRMAGLPPAAWRQRYGTAR